jgi:FkbM family methyltransferase
MIFISLGWNCSPAIMRKNVFKYSKENGYKTCPFDLCVTPYQSLIDCLQDDFKKFFNLRIENGIIMNEYNIWFNHEAPGELYSNNNFEKFKERYTNRINSFREYLSGNFKVCFIHSDPFHSSEEIDKIINEKYPNLVYKILSIHNCDIDVYKNHFSSNSDCKSHSVMGLNIIFENKKYNDNNNIYNCNSDENIETFFNKHINHVCYSNKYGKYYCPIGLEKGIDWIIKNGYVHEEETLCFIKNNIASNGTIITAGTHIGTFLPFYSKIANKVYGFEPIFENYHYAKLNIELNILNNVKIFNFALGSKECELYMVEHNLIEKSLCRVVNEYNDNCSKVKCIKLDDLDELLNENISIIQLDVEGYENNVLLGAIKIIEKFNPILILENNYKHYDIPDFLKKYNYVLHDKKINENIVLFIEDIHLLNF